MKKFISRYFFFWLPAFLLAVIPSGILPFSTHIILGWICTAAMMIGWSYTTAMMTYEEPNRTLGIFLMFTGLSFLGLSFVYSGAYRRYAPKITHMLAGLFTYVPLAPLVEALRDFSIVQELVAILVLLAFNLFGFLFGLLQRALHPNPYRPRIETPSTKK